MKNPVCFDRFGNKSAEERREKKGARILKGGGSLPLLLHTRLEKKNMSEGASLNSYLTRMGEGGFGCCYLTRTGALTLSAC